MLNIKEQQTYLYFCKTAITVVVLVPISLGQYSDFTTTIIVRNSITVFWNSTILVQKGADPSRSETPWVKTSQIMYEVLEICDDNDKYWPSWYFDIWRYRLLWFSLSRNYDNISNYNIIASYNHGFYQNKSLHIKCRRWNRTWNGSKCRNQHHDSGYSTTDTTSCRLISKCLSMRQLIMSVQEVLITGCACMHVCLLCMGIPGPHTYGSRT